MEKLPAKVMSVLVVAGTIALGVLAIAASGSGAI
jgi:hypothetical protein